MRATLPVLTGWILLAGSAVAGPILESVPFKLGPKAFQEGDVIQIREVESTSAAFEPGDTVKIQGRYWLSSREQAILQLELVPGEGAGKTEVEKAERIIAEPGAHDFEVSIFIQRRGILRLTYREIDSEIPFGVLSFGTPGQMAQANEKGIDAELLPILPQGDDEKKEEDLVKSPRLRYDYSFGPEVLDLMKDVIETDPNREKHPKVKQPGVLWSAPETGEGGGFKDSGDPPKGDLHSKWPPPEFRIENGKGFPSPEEPIEPLRPPIPDDNP